MSCLKSGTTWPAGGTDPHADSGWTSDRYMPRLRDVYRLDPDAVAFDFDEVVAALVLAADRALPLRLRPVLHEDVHPPLFHLQLHPAHQPRLGQSKNLLIKLSVSHPGMLPGWQRPTEKPEGPSK